MRKEWALMGHKTGKALGVATATSPEAACRQLLGPVPSGHWERVATPGEAYGDLIIATSGQERVLVFAAENG